MRSACSAAAATISGDAVAEAGDHRAARTGVEDPAAVGRGEPDALAAFDARVRRGRGSGGTRVSFERDPVVSCAQLTAGRRRRRSRAARPRVEVAFEELQRASAGSPSRVAFVSSSSASGSTPSCVELVAVCAHPVVHDLGSSPRDGTGARGSVPRRTPAGRRRSRRSRSRRGASVNVSKCHWNHGPSGTSSGSVAPDGEPADLGTSPRNTSPPSTRASIWPPKQSPSTGTSSSHRRLASAAPRAARTACESSNAANSEPSDTIRSYVARVDLAVVEVDPERRRPRRRAREPLGDVGPAAWAPRAAGSGACSGVSVSTHRTAPAVVGDGLPRRAPARRPRATSVHGVGEPARPSRPARRRSSVNGGANSVWSPAYPSRVGWVESDDQPALERGVRRSARRPGARGGRNDSPSRGSTYDTPSR